MPDDDPSWLDDYAAYRDANPRQPAQRKDPGPNEERRYICPKCEKELSLDYCKSVELIVAYTVKPQTPRLVRIVHACPCQAWVRSTRYPYDTGALTRLFGGPPVLPWPRPIGEGEGRVADTPPVTSHYQTRDDRVARWRWDLEGVETARDFLLFCRGLRDDIEPLPPTE